MKAPLLLCCLNLLIVALLAVSGPAAAAEPDLSKALVIGHGPKTVVEFTDPDCPFCRRAAAYFATRTDVTLYVFFLPLAKHPEAKRKAQYILSQTDPATAYDEVMAGYLDNADIRALHTTPRGVKLQGQQYEIARKAGIEATPTFLLFGRIVEGFDLWKIEELLGKQR